MRQTLLTQNTNLTIRKTRLIIILIIIIRRRRRRRRKKKKKISTALPVSNK